MGLRYFMLMNEIDGVRAFYTVANALGKAAKFVSCGYIPFCFVLGVVKQLLLIELAARVCIKDGVGSFNLFIEVGKSISKAAMEESGNSIGLWLT
jgi:hypothetical protein